MAADLKPCPICGGSAELRTTGGWSGIGCNTDKCPALLHALMFRTPAEAVAVWNRRAAPGVLGTPRRDGCTAGTDEECLRPNCATRCPAGVTASVPRKATNAEIAEWAERHDLRGSTTDLRATFEDAESLHLTYGVGGTDGR